MGTQQVSNEDYTHFQSRQAVERLREGLFDPLAVRLLTAQEQRLHKTLQEIWKAFSKNRSTQLCICGAYGQGKSHHLTYIQEQALQQGFVTSFINLDPREIPFQQFRQVYQTLILACQFPGQEQSLVSHWQEWVSQHIKAETAEQIEAELLRKLPELPHLLTCLLVALAQETIVLSPDQRHHPKHRTYRPREFPFLLEQALLGEVVPAAKLRPAFYYRQLSFYRQAALSCNKPEGWLLMLQGVAQVIKLMGYRGWVLLFDEGESIAELRLPARRNSYKLLQQFFQPEQFQPLVPIFAFTEHFFQTLENEDYERVHIRQQQEQLYFENNYAEEWDKVKRYQLQDLTQAEWRQLISKLIALYNHAYGYQITNSKTITTRLQKQLAITTGLETRFCLKSLVNELDLYFQEKH